MMNEVRENVDRIRRELAEASEGRYPTPRLMAVTKTRGAEEILPLAGFWRAEEYHQQYLDKNPGGYCHIPAEKLNLCGGGKKA